MSKSNNVTAMLSFRLRVKRSLLCLAAAASLAACSSLDTYPSSFNVFFTANSTTLTPEAVAIIGHAANAIKRLVPKTVAIAAGSAAGANLNLAKPRYEAVRSALIGDGVASKVIAEASLPKIGVETTEKGNQRVEIILGAK